MEENKHEKTTRTTEPPKNPEVLEQPNDVIIEHSKKSGFAGRKKLFLIAGIAAVLIGGGVFAWSVFGNTPEATAPVAKQSEKSEEPTAPSKLIYAYKVDNKTVVREYDTANESQKELFEFVETHEVDLENYFGTHRNPSVSISPDLKSVAYLSEKGLFIRDLNNGGVDQVIGATQNPDDGGAKSGDYVLLPDSGTKSAIFNLSEPNWSLDGSAIGFYVGHYENVAVNAINIKTGEYANPEDTQRYGGEGTDRVQSLKLNPKNATLVEFGVLPKFAIAADWSVLSPRFNADKSRIIAVLCPVDEFESGDFSIAEEPSNGVARRDCGESGNKELVRIDYSEGKYDVLAKGNYTGDMAITDQDIAYLPSVDKKTIYKVNMATNKSEQISVVNKVELGDSAKITDVRVFGEQDVAAIQYKEGSKNHVQIISIDSGKSFGTFEVAQVSAFKPLLVY